MTETARPTDLACGECIDRVTDDMVLYSRHPTDRPESYNNLEQGEDWVFCDVCFQEFVDGDWYDEHH